MATGPLGFDPAVSRFAQVVASTGVIEGASVRWPRDEGEALTSASGVFYYDYYLRVESERPSESPQFRVVADDPPYTLTPYTPPAGPGEPKGTCSPAWVVEPRSLPEQIAAIRDHQQRVVNALIPASNEPAQRVLTMDALHTEFSGGQLTADQQETLVENTESASLVRLCEEIAKDLIARATAGTAYDIAEDVRWPITLAQLNAQIGEY